MVIFVRGFRGYGSVLCMTERKPYAPPVLTKVTPEHAQILLLVRAGQDDKNAKELLELVDPDTPYKP